MRKCTLWLLLAAFLLTLAPSAAAQEPAPTPITTVEELQNMDPAGSYILMNDLDLAGVDWVPLALSGSFDGNGHTLLNLTLTRVSEELGMAYDGNWKEYETRFSGMFSFVSGIVRNLKLVNVRGMVECAEPCFLGGLVGRLDGGTVSNCSVTGTLELRAFDRCFGVGGLVGHGIGNVENCDVDVTLICVDTQPEADEQFLGGLYASGFINVTGCTVNLDGYASEHGYAHNGGIVGMFAQYPARTWELGTLTDCHVTGKITFFEEVRSRRAYCAPIIGELCVNNQNILGNTHEFTRDERSDYTLELRPEMCENPVYREEAVPGICPEFGFCIYTCETCGYTYRDHYTLPQHTPGEWAVVTEPTRESEGLAESACVTCGLALQQVLPVDDSPTEPPTEAETEPTVPANEPEQEAGNRYLPAGIGALALLGLILLLFRTRKQKKARNNKTQ